MNLTNNETFKLKFMESIKIVGDIIDITGVTPALLDALAAQNLTIDVLRAILFDDIIMTTFMNLGTGSRDPAFNLGNGYLLKGIILELDRLESLSSSTKKKNKMSYTKKNVKKTLRTGKKVKDHVERHLLLIVDHYKEKATDINAKHHVDVTVEVTRKYRNMIRLLQVKGARNEKVLEKEIKLNDEGDVDSNTINSLFLKVVRIKFGLR